MSRAVRREAGRTGPISPLDGPAAPSPSPSLVFVGCLAGTLLLHVAAPVVDLVSGPWRHLGLAGIGLGALLHAASSRALAAVGTTREPGGRPTALVTRGPYGLSRHPMYLAGAVILAGTALYLGSLSPWAAVPLWVAVVERRLIAPEERRLRLAFGEAYLAYRRRVRRWI